MFSRLSHAIDPAPDALIAEALGADGVYASSVSRLGATAAALGLALILALPVWWFGSRIQPTLYFVLGSPHEQRHKPMPTLPDPVISVSRIVHWTSRALSETLTFNFNDVDDRLRAAGVYYTPAARLSMQQSTVQNKIVEQVKASHLAVVLTPIAQPRLTQSFKVNGTSYWELEAPVILTYIGASRQQVRGMKILVRIKQVPTTQTPDGLEIAGFFAESAALN